MIFNVLTHTLTIFCSGWMYTIWGIIMVVTELLILLVIWKGGKWRERAEEREARSRLKQ